MSVRDHETSRPAPASRALLACALALAFQSAGAQPASPVAAVRLAGPASAANSPPAAADSLASPTSSSATAAEIQKINEQMALLQAQLNQLELKAKIATKQKEIKGEPAERTQSSFDSKSGNPSVVSVAGLKGKLEAVLVFPGGVSQRVKVGDIIDDRRVAKVELNEVVLTDLKGSSVQRLAFGTSPVLREKPQQSGTSQTGLPGIPPPPIPPGLR